ncbi:MAG: hypothetical protein ABR921_19000 [Candidatus Sulfotelmatobacter sp.]|jgi:hypothetical protein
MSDPKQKPASPALSAGIVLAMVMMVAVPAAITLHSVRSPATLVSTSSNPSPYGYTWSLLLFVVPILVILLWFLPSEGLQIPQRAFWRTIVILVPLGWLLDFLFAQYFFCYPNLKATLGIHAWALGRPVPIEEHVFYLTGFVAVLLLYVWLGEYWLAAYSVLDYPGEARKIIRLLRFHPRSLIVGAVLVGAAWFYKRHWAPLDAHGRFPGYFAFLVAGALVPSISFFPIARRFINWRAFSLTAFFMLLISLLWEVTLALPYGWWNFQHRQMIGLFIGAWNDLPIEEVCLWIAVTYATVIIFEIVKLWQASGRTMKKALLGAKAVPVTRL